MIIQCMYQWAFGRGPLHWMCGWLWSKGTEKCMMMMTGWSWERATSVCGVVRFLLVIWCNIFLLQPLVDSCVLCRLLCAFLNSCRLHTIGGTAVGSCQRLFVQNCTFAAKSRDCQSWQLQFSGREFGDFDARHNYCYYITIWIIIAKWGRTVW